MVKPPRRPPGKAAKDRKADAGGSVAPTPTQQARGGPEMGSGIAKQTMPTPTLQSGTPQEQEQPDPATEVNKEQAITGDVGETATASLSVTRTFSTKKDSEQPDAEAIVHTSAAAASTDTEIDGPAAEPDSSALGSFALGSSVLGGSGDVSVEPGAAQLELEGFAPGVKVGPGAIPVSEVARQHTASKGQLAKLQEALGGFHGYDATGPRNSVEIPLSQDQLETMSAAVASALVLHKAPTLTRSILNALDNFGQIIDKFGDVMEKAGKAAVKAGKAAEETGKAWAKAAEAYQGLALKAAGACLAIKELIDIAMSMFGG